MRLCDSDTNVARHAPALPPSDLTVFRFMLCSSSGAASGAQLRACTYICWKACWPVTGSGGGAAFCVSVVGAVEEHPVKIAVTAVRTATVAVRFMPYHSTRPPPQDASEPGPDFPAWNRDS